MAIFRIFFAFMLTFSLLSTTEAQTTGKKKFVKPGTEEPAKKGKEDTKEKSEEPQEEDYAAQKVEKEPSRWGYGLNIGNIAFQSNAYQIGLDPNVAYRLSDNLAVGFMLKMNYYHARYQYTNNTKLTYSAFDTGPTLFTRWKPLLKMDNATPFMQGIFLMAEYERSFVNREAVDEFGNLILNDDGTKIETVITTEHYLYIGGGVSSGYPFSSFFSFHYNLLDDAELSRLPFTYRIGFTWNY